MDYNKWSTLDGDCHEEQVSIAETSGEYELEQLKLAADVVFARAEEQSSTVENKEPYHQCIQMYSRIIQSSETNLIIGFDELGCLLNIACCAIRIANWQLAESSCRKALIRIKGSDFKIRVRALYFITYALLRQSAEVADITPKKAELLQQAFSEAKQLSELIRTHQHHIDSNEMQDYTLLMRKLEEAKERAQGEAQGCAGQNFAAASTHQLEGNDVKAAECLIRCASALLSAACDETTSCAAARLQIQAGVIHLRLRLYKEAYACFAQVHTTCPGQILLTAIAHAYSATCLRCSGTISSNNTAATGDTTIEQALLGAIENFETCVFQQATEQPSDVSADNIHFAVHLLSKQAHRIQNASFLSDTTSVEISPGSCTLALHQHLFGAYDALADHFAGAGQHDMCNFVTDRTIEACGILIAQCAASNSSSITSGAAKAASPAESAAAAAAAAARKDKSTPSDDIFDMLLTRRAKCFVAKALLYKDHSIASARISGAKPYTGRTIPWTFLLQPAAVSRRNPNNSSNRVLQLNRYGAMHKAVFDSIPEAVAVFLQVAGEEYEPLNLAQSMRTYQILAAYTMQHAGIEPFQLDSNSVTTSSTQPGIDKKDLAEKGAEAFKKVSLLASQKISAIDVAIKAAVPSQESTADEVKLTSLYSEKYFFLQQSMLALYSAGVCAFHCDNTLAQRHLESAECVRKDIDTLLSTKLQKQYDFNSLIKSASAAGTSTTADSNSADRDSASATTALGGGGVSEDPRETASPATQLQDRSLHGYYAACGDLAFHLAHAYLRLGSYPEALQESGAAALFYQHSERLLFALNCFGTGTAKEQKQHRALMREGVAELVIPLREMTPGGRLRQRQAQGLVALCCSACGEDQKAERALQSVADLCLGPIEDAERETRAVRRTISQQKGAVMDQLRADREQSSTCSISSSTSTASTLHTTNAGAGNIPASSAPATTKVSQSQEQKNAAAGIHNVRWETRNDDSSSAVLSEPTREFDFNLLVAYSILAATIAFIASLIVKF